MGNESQQIQLMRNHMSRIVYENEEGQSRMGYFVNAQDLLDQMNESGFMTRLGYHEANELIDVFFDGDRPAENNDPRLPLTSLTMLHYIKRSMTTLTMAATMDIRIGNNTVFTRMVKMHGEKNSKLLIIIVFTGSSESS